MGVGTPAKCGWHLLEAAPARRAGRLKDLSPVLSAFPLAAELIDPVVAASSSEPAFPSSLGTL
ncbi:hypothetical protein I79_017102 [Cricetulus griseus]|uniref:Uncharacterized protein n=1 Tax=Cricetulus griseus TaxID=10029 RepID=G3I156_CRIGR|nr:hypothetical protein I79_017102 [Cricetulus griseus]